jgi:hypothetical protein
MYLSQGVVWILQKPETCDGDCRLSIPYHAFLKYVSGDLLGILCAQVIPTPWKIS